MDNLKYLEKQKKIEDVREKERRGESFKCAGEHEIEHRKTKALEIIAEELCKYNISLSKFSKELDEANKLVEECNKGGE